MLRAVGITRRFGLQPRQQRLAAVRVAALAAACLLAVAGCGGPSSAYYPGNDPLAATLGSLSIYQLAGRMDLAVVMSGRSSALLRDRANVVNIYPDPGGQAYVNGRQVGPSGGIVPVDGMLFVPEALAEAIALSLRPPPPVAPTARKAPGPSAPPCRGLVVIDPGHGGKDPGAISVYGEREKNIVLGVALATARQLRSRGLDVRMTRGDDTFVPLNDRADLANELGADLFVSIHADSAGNRSATGFTCYIARGASAASLQSAGRIAKTLLAGGSHSRGVRKANYRVLVRTACPAVLVELGYLSNGWEAGRLGDRRYQRVLSQALADGVLGFFQAR